MKKLMIAAAIALAACTSNQTPATETTGDAELLTGQWEVEVIDGVDVIADSLESAPTLCFELTADTLRAYGNLSCNTFTCLPEVGDGEINLSNMGSTMMMCPDMETEQAYIAALAKAATYTVDDATLTLFDAEGNAVVICSKAE